MPKRLHLGQEQSSGAGDKSSAVVAEPILLAGQGCFGLDVKKPLLAKAARSGAPGFLDGY
jgi:hypothetical protein